MAARGEGLGRVFNVVHQASGVSIPVTRGQAVTFISFLDAGTHTLDFTQTDSTAVLGEIDLPLFNQSPANLGSRIHAGAGTGGTWINVTSSAVDANTADGADATNDTYAVTVRAEQLNDGYDRVKCTPSSGTCIAIIHDLAVQRKPVNLRSSLVV